MGIKQTVSVEYIKSEVELGCFYGTAYLKVSGLRLWVEIGWLELFPEEALELARYRMELYVHSNGRRVYCYETPGFLTAAEAEQLYLESVQGTSEALEHKEPWLLKDIKRVLQQRVAINHETKHISS